MVKPMFQRSKTKKPPKVTFTLEQFHEWYRGRELVCHYCGIPQHLVESLGLINAFFKNPIRRLGIDRRNNDRNYNLNNMDLCCNGCNMVKGYRYTEKEMATIAPAIASIWRARLLAMGIDDPWVTGG